VFKEKWTDIGNKPLTVICIAKLHLLISTLTITLFSHATIND